MIGKLVAKKLLRETKIQVDLAKSGRECLELTRQHFYHVIFPHYLALYYIHLFIFSNHFPIRLKAEDRTFVLFTADSHWM